MNAIRNILINVYKQKETQRKNLSTKYMEKCLTTSGSISSGEINRSKHRPEMVQTKSSFVGSIITSLHVSSQTTQTEGKVNSLHHPCQILKWEETILFIKVSSCLWLWPKEKDGLTMNIPSLLTHKYISDLIVSAVFSGASMIGYCCFS